MVKIKGLESSTTNLIGKDDIILIEFTRDVSDSELTLCTSDGDLADKKTSSGVLVSSLHGTTVEVADFLKGGAGKITIKEARFDDEATAKATNAYSTGEATAADVEIEISTGTDQIKAGDVITINLQKCDLNQSKNVGKEALRLQVGANGGQEVQIQIKSMKAKDLGITQTSLSRLNGIGKETTGTVGSALDVTSQASASLAIEAYDNALQNVSTERAKMGAMQNRLEHTINNLDTSSENLQSAESNIRDTDMATEMTQYSKNNILMQAGQSMLAQANQSNQGVLSLLQ